MIYERAGEKRALLSLYKIFHWLIRTEPSRWCPSLGVHLPIENVSRVVIIWNPLMDVSRGPRLVSTFSGCSIKRSDIHWFSGYYCVTKEANSPLEFVASFHACLAWNSRLFGITCRIWPCVFSIIPLRRNFGSELTNIIRYLRCPTRELPDATKTICYSRDYYECRIDINRVSKSERACALSAIFDNETWQIVM